MSLNIKHKCSWLNYRTKPITEMLLFYLFLLTATKGRNRMGRWFDFMNLRETDSTIMTLKSFLHIERHKTNLSNQDSIISIFYCICPVTHSKYVSFTPILPVSPQCLADSWHSLDSQCVTLICDLYKQLNKGLLFSNLPSQWLVDSWRVNHYSGFRFIFFNYHLYCSEIQLNECIVSP